MISAKNTDEIQPSIINLSELQLLVLKSEDYTASWVFFDISDHPDKLELKSIIDKTIPEKIDQIKRDSEKWEKKDRTLFRQICSNIDSMKIHQTWIMENLNHIDAYGDPTIVPFAENHEVQVKTLTSNTILALETIIENKKTQSEKEENIAQKSFKSIKIVHIVLAIVAILVVLVVAYKTIRTIRLEQQKMLLTEERDQIKAQKVIIEEKNNEILSSINYAERLQKSILPDASDLSNYFSEQFIYYRPRDIVSGDFYWIRDLGDKLLVAAADCTGHGVPGAFVSFVGYSALNRAVDQYQLNYPAEILEKTSEMVENTFSNQGRSDGLSDGMDISLITIDKSTNRLSYSGAHNSIYIMRSCDVHVLKATARSVGANVHTKPFVEHHFDLQKGDMIYLFSDGYHDQFGGEKGKKYMSKNFQKFLCSISKETCNTQGKQMEEEMINWRGQEEQIDDILVIGLKV